MSFIVRDLPTTCTDRRFYHVSPSHTLPPKSLYVAPRERERTERVNPLETLYVKAM